MSLHQAITNARVHQTRLLLDIETDPNTPDHDSRTPLMLACFIDKEHIGLRVTKMLLEKGAKVNKKDKHGRTALSYAAMNGRDKIVQILLEDIEYDINCPDEIGNTPLMYAAMSGNAAALRPILAVLLKYRLSVDVRNEKGFSAYLLAAKMGHFYCAHILKAEGYASDRIRDTEYFLSDKEWVRKTRKEIERLKISERSTALSPRTPTRPHTSLEFRKSPPSPRVRAVSRLTNRSEPQHMKYNSWVNTDDSPPSRTSSASTVPGESLLDYESTEVTEKIPSVARTKTPDLHAILSHYMSEDVYRPVKITPYNTKAKEVRFTEEETVKSGRETSNRHRKQSKANRKRTVYK
ncbi:ankyrin repeat and SAM domain-containing protein 3 [Nematostella vectensis]|uniref:ankyrin repeat and SAM domain-containing protein 3 n=1 Tax=Nematostella vectensis TaxID=45351 RepID=UPI00139042BD|nr:ankyrin repeat and SAM domain-containing protein 3 [Nematostella vectensis]